MSAKKPILKVLSNQKTQLSPLTRTKSELQNFLLNNTTKFQPDWLRTQTFQLKLFNIAVTLEYGQGH